MKRRQQSSGHEKRKAKKRAEEEAARLPKLTNFFPVTSNVDNVSNIDVPNNQMSEESTPNVTQQSEEHGVAIDTVWTKSCAESHASGAASPDFVPLGNDPGCWPDKISDGQRCDIVKRGVEQIQIDFPYNEARRRFSTAHYSRVMPNGEQVKRSWLVYSPSKDMIFCTYCKLFGAVRNVPLVCGTNTWEGLSKKLREHENGTSHRSCLSKAAELKTRIEKGAAIDEQEIVSFFREKRFWRDVIERFIDIVVFLAERQLAFRGSDDKLGSQTNGNFLGLFELMSKRDPILKELQGRILNKTTKDHYLSHDIQNELIELVAKNILKTNLAELKTAKYYSVILDCTPDASHNEQMTMILRFLRCESGKGATIREIFAGYLNVDDTTGSGLLDAFLKRIEELGLDIQDCRGQGCDNGSNMRGKTQGVQARLLQINSKALFVPCGAHSLNLVVVDAVKASIDATNFFGIITRMYTIFAGSPARWNIMKQFVALTVKRQSDTRWESRINCLKPLRYCLDGVIKALDMLVEHSLDKRDGATASEAGSLKEKMLSWPFIVSIVYWHDIFFQINKTSKLLQSTSASLDTMVSEMSATMKFLQTYREIGYESAQVDAREIAEKLGVEQTFPERRVRRGSRLFFFESQGDVINAEQQHKRAFFEILDSTIESIGSRFGHLEKFSALFGFIYNRENLDKACNDHILNQSCAQFNEELGDVVAAEFEDELTRFVCVDSDKTGSSALEFLNYICKSRLNEMYPNLCIALRLLLTTPVSVACAERSFSKLKLIKTYLRSAMTDKRLCGLSMIAIERHVARNLDYSALIDEFAIKKATRNKLL